MSARKQSVDTRQLYPAKLGKSQVARLGDLADRFAIDRDDILVVAVERGLAITEAQLIAGVDVATIAVARRVEKKGKGAKIAAGYVRGDGEAGLYLGFKDKQGRAFLKFRKEKNIPYALIEEVPVYRLADLDAAWAASIPQNLR